MGEILHRNVKKENDEQYKNRWPLSADARRNLYLKYARQYPVDVAIQRELIPEDAEINPYDKPPRDMWNEIAGDIMQKLGPDTSHLIGLDIGASNGYFITQMLRQGYLGRLIGVDLEMETQDVVETIIREEFPNADIALGGSDAQILRQVKFFDDDNKVRTERIPASSVDFATALFLLYHVPRVEQAYNSIHRVVKPDGIVVFSSRHQLNQNHLWNLGAQVAIGFNLPKPPLSFYDHHDLAQMESFLDNSSKYELLETVRQGENLWIPNNEDAWQDYKWALMTLPYEKDPATGRSISVKAMSSFIEDNIRPQFESNATANDGYYIDYVFQSYYVCRVLK